MSWSRREDVKEVMGQEDDFTFTLSEVQVEQRSDMM